MYDTILIPTDGSEHAERAAEHALELARAFDAEVHVLGVADVQAAAGVFDAGGVDEEFVDQLESEVRETVDAAEALARESDAVRTAVVHGTPSDAILEYAEDHDVEMIAMGTHGRTGLNRYIAGNVTERVVRLADVPVFTVRATERSVAGDGYDRVLIPTDGSDCAAVAVDHGIAIAEAFDAEVHALNVVDIGAVATSSDIALPTETVEQFERSGRRAVDAVAERAREAGLEVVTEVVEAFPASGLLEYAEENDIDLITMGTHGRGGFDRFFLGSMTAKVVRHAEMPVLSVPGGDRGPAEGDESE